jgi:hydrogenase nickel incorporation protein HypA/HybF
MHELAITQGILDIALDEANKRGLSRVLSITIKLGEFSGVVPQLIQEYYNLVAKGTPAENAELIVEKVPVTVRCLACGAESTVPRRQIRCPACQSQEIKMLTGREFYVSSMEVE